MSERNEGKKSRKYGNFKDSKRPMILVKKDDRDNEHRICEKSSEGQNAQPKIILKSKEKEVKEQPVQINIALREKDAGSNFSTRVLSQAKELTLPIVVEQQSVQIPLMKKSVELVSSNFPVNTQCFDFLNESNSLFLVVGVIGMRSVGKSTILNLLTPCDVKNLNSIVDKFYAREEHIFPTRDYISSSTVSDGIQIFITEDRTILLDCSPIITNQYKKDCIVNEIDDLKLVIFMLSVCHLVIVVQEDGINTNLIRLIQNAEMMKPNFSKDVGDEHYANIMFLKNLANRIDFTNDSKEKNHQIYKLLFKNSNLRIFPGNYTQKELKTELNVNTIEFPKIEKHVLPYNGYPTLAEQIKKLRQRIFMSPRNPMLKTGPTFTEKIWSQHVQNVWESHKSNFFLRKYESLKEKTSLHSHRERDIENGNLLTKERNYYDF